MRYLTIIILVLALCISRITFSQWQLRSNGLPQSFGVGISIDAVSKTTAYIAGSRGIYLTTDSGNSWKNVYKEYINDITVINNDIALAVSESKIIKTTNRGNTWNVVFEISKDLNPFFNYIKAFSNSIIAMADALNKNSPAQFLKSTDQGNSWQQINKTCLLGGGSSDIFHRLDFGSPQIGIFNCSFSSSSGNYRTTDGGESWTNLGLSTIFLNVKMYDQKYGLAWSPNYPNSYIHQTQDSGLTWKNILTALPMPRAFGFIPNNPAEVFSASNKLFYSADSGKTWINQNFTFVIPTDRIEDIVFVNEACGWIVTVNGSVYWTDNKGNAVVNVKEEDYLPTASKLEQNYPNPFNPTTTIMYSIPLLENGKKNNVTLKIFDLLGREITTLVNESKEAGNYYVTFNATGLPSSIYLYKLNVGEYSEIKKMLLIK